MTPSTSLQALLDLLDLETIEVDLYRGQSPTTTSQRVFGGQVAGQALVAAVRTVAPERRVHSLHAYFLLPGEPEVPIIYQVDRIRDGRSFTTRRVDARQHGRSIFHLSASFQVVEEGIEHAAPMPDVPDPDELPDFRDVLAERHLEWDEPFAEWGSIDLRYVTDPITAAEQRGDRYQLWFRAGEPMADDPLLHTCVLTYMSDMSLLGSVLPRHGLVPGTHEMQMASLDHAMWFHRPFRADEWLLYDQRSPAASGARGFTIGEIFDRRGMLVCTVAQEGLVRPRRG